MAALVWLGFLISLGSLLIVSRWSLWIAMFLAGLILGIFAIPEEMWEVIFRTLIDPSVLLLALAVGLIPIIGGIMDRSGLMDSLVNNLRIGKRPFLMVSPSLVGMLPMPGGALLSAPLLDKGSEGVSNAHKVTINVWFRHILYLVYPLSSALIVGSKIAGLDIYTVLPYMIPCLLTLFIIGYLFFVRGVKGEMRYKGTFSYTGLFLPLSIILIAPAIDFSISQLFDFEVREVSLVIAVFISLTLAIYISKIKKRGMKAVIRKMRPWRFSLIVLGMFVFLYIFIDSGVPELISDLSPSKLVLCVFIGFLLGFATGRIQLSLSIIVPIYMTNFALIAMEPAVFAITYFSIFLGYLISPVHPCTTVSMEYFKVQPKDFFKAMIFPILTGLIIAIVVALLFL